MTESSSLVIIKKYANRRLYNTDTSCYITLDDLYDMVREGTEFVVRDAKTDEDITRSVLTQIILDRETGGGDSLLPIAFLKQIIGFYEHRGKEMLPPYLEASLSHFMKHQEDIRGYFEKTMENYFPLSHFEQIGRQNMDMFQKAWGMFTPAPPKDDKDEDGTR